MIPALVPYDLLALTYLRAVDEGRPPRRAWREELGLTARQADHRRTYMSATAWLPKGDPALDCRRKGVYDDVWKAQARSMLAAKLKARREQADRALARREKTEQDARLYADYIEGLFAALAASPTAAGTLGPARYAPGPTQTPARPAGKRGGPVLDLFG